MRLFVYESLPVYSQQVCVFGEDVLNTSKGQEVAMTHRCFASQVHTRSSDDVTVFTIFGNFW